MTEFNSMADQSVDETMGKEDMCSHQSGSTASTLQPIATAMDTEGIMSATTKTNLGESCFNQTGIQPSMNVNPLDYDHSLNQPLPELKVMPMTLLQKIKYKTVIQSPLQSLTVVMLKT